MYSSTCNSPVLKNVKELAAIADYCNARKQDARKASEESAEVFFTVFVKVSRQPTRIKSKHRLEAQLVNLTAPSAIIFGPENGIQSRQ